MIEVTVKKGFGVRTLKTIITKLNIKDGDVLLVTMDDPTQYEMNEVGKMYGRAFPKNRIVMTTSHVEVLAQKDAVEDNAEL